MCLDGSVGEPPSFGEVARFAEVSVGPEPAEIFVSAVSRDLVGRGQSKESDSSPPVRGPGEDTHGRILECTDAFLPRSNGQEGIIVRRRSCFRYDSQTKNEDDKKLAHGIPPDCAFFRPFSVIEKGINCQINPEIIS